MYVLNNHYYTTLTLDRKALYPNGRMDVKQQCVLTWQVHTTSSAAREKGIQALCKQTISGQLDRKGRGVGVQRKHQQIIIEYSTLTHSL